MRRARFGMFSLVAAGIGFMAACADPPPDGPPGTGTQLLASERECNPLDEAACIAKHREGCQPVYNESCVDRVCSTGRFERCTFVPPGPPGPCDGLDEATCIQTTGCVAVEGQVCNRSGCGPGYIGCSAAPRS